MSDDDLPTAPEAPDGAFPAQPKLTHCAKHPERVTTFTCERCGDFGCSECQSLRSADLCERCASMVALSTTASPWAISAVVLGFFGVGCAPIGWIGIVSALVDLGLGFRQGRSAGRLLSVIGIVLGTVGTVLWVIALWNAVMNPAAYSDL